MQFNAYSGLDVHKETIVIAIAEAGRKAEVHFHGEIANTPDAVARMLKKLVAAMASCTSSTKQVPADMVSIARSMPRARSARSSLQLTRQDAQAIASRPIDAML